MGPGEENSGKLVTRVRQKAKDIAFETGADFIINDGPPGIGCSAISSVTGTDLVLLIIEPTMSGLHDAKRLAELVKNFNIPILAVINKFDLNPKASEDVIQFLAENNIGLIGKINFDAGAVESMVAALSVVEFSPGGVFSKEIYYIWDQIRDQFKI
jgi:MinD superfamily P-loop ATPase